MVTQLSLYCIKAGGLPGFRHQWVMRRRRTTAHETRSHDAFRVYQASFKGISKWGRASFPLQKTPIGSWFPTLPTNIRNCMCYERCNDKIKWGTYEILYLWAQNSAY